MSNYPNTDHGTVSVYADDITILEEHNLIPYLVTVWARAYMTALLCLNLAVLSMSRTRRASGRPCRLSPNTRASVSRGRPPRPGRPAGRRWCTPPCRTAAGPARSERRTRPASRAARRSGSRCAASAGRTPARGTAPPSSGPRRSRPAPSGPPGCGGRRPWFEPELCPRPPGSGAGRRARDRRLDTNPTHARQTRSRTLRGRFWMD